MGFTLFVLFEAMIALSIIGTIFAVTHYDSLAVRFLPRRLQLRYFPVAVSIAILIVERPDQWTSTRYTLTHEDVGSIWIANGAYALKVETEVGDWHPSPIERRIIRKAVDWRIDTYIRNRIGAAVQKNAIFEVDPKALS